MSKIYLGVTHYGACHAIFHCDHTPTIEEFGSAYAYIVGPFRTMRGAEFMRDYGKSNPHCQTVSQAEKLAKAQEEKENLIASLTTRLTTCPLEQFDDVKGQLVALKSH